MNQGTPKLFHKPVDVDWQSERGTPLDRVKHLLETGWETGLLADLEFLVGGNHGDQEVFSIKNFPIAFHHFKIKIFNSARLSKPIKLSWQ